MSRQKRDNQPASVPEAKQAGEMIARWAWVEPAVWTDRMLMALEGGVKGGQWFSLIDKVYRLPVLRAAFDRVKRNGGAAGVDHVTIERFEKRLDEELERLSEELRSGQYRPRRIRRVWIEKPGRRELRPLGIPTVRDRVVQAAVRSVIEPIFEAGFADSSWGFRPRRSCHDAIRTVIEHLDAEYTWVVDADIRSFFEEMDHEILMAEVATRISDSRVLSLIESFLGQAVMGDLGSWTPQRGSPQGAVLSPLLSNIYLNPLDQALEARGLRAVRYADDLVILCRSRAEAEGALRALGAWLADHGLALHPEKTRIVDAKERGGFDFLGYHFERGYQYPSGRSEARFRAQLRRKTKRTQGRSLQAVIADVNQVTVGWWHYHRLASPWAFRDLDAWLRMRLRSILRKQRRGRGRGRGADHQRWPKRFFLEQGLFSLDGASQHVRQPSWR